MGHRWLSALEVTSLRNLAQVALTPGPTMNLLVGPNGSGKTSVLEAIHLLAVGRSFLTAQASTYVRHGSQATAIFGRLETGDRPIRLGVEKNLAGGGEVRMNGERVQGHAPIAHELPLILITPESHAVISGGPAERRALLDWGLFHVEHSYLALWRRYQRLLKQRNAALGSSMAIKQWNEGLAEAGEGLSAHRQAYLEALRAPLQTILAILAPELPPISVDYLPGWTAESSLLAALVADDDRDRRDRITHSGPHRAELRIRVEGKRASQVLSRGQEKVVLSALRLAQLQHLRESVSKDAVVLIDDLPAELDGAHRSTFLALLASLGVQVFVTATEQQLLSFPHDCVPKVFHVEHGSVHAVI